MFRFILLHRVSKFGTHCTLLHSTEKFLISVLKDKMEKCAEDIWEKKKEICNNLVWKE